MTSAERVLAPDAMKPENILATQEAIQPYGRYTS
jgi:hypothetical protein